MIYRYFCVVLIPCVKRTAEKSPKTMAEMSVIEVVCPGFLKPKVVRHWLTMEKKDIKVPNPKDMAIHILT